LLDELVEAIPYLDTYRLDHHLRNHYLRNWPLKSEDSIKTLEANTENKIMKINKQTDYNK